MVGDRTARLSGPAWPAAGREYSFTGTSPGPTCQIARVNCSKLVVAHLQSVQQPLPPPECKLRGRAEGGADARQAGGRLPLPPSHHPVHWQNSVLNPQGLICNMKNLWFRFSGLVLKQNVEVFGLAKTVQWSIVVAPEIISVLWSLSFHPI